MTTRLALEFQVDDDDDDDDDDDNVNVVFSVVRRSTLKHVPASNSLSMVNAYCRPRKS